MTRTAVLEPLESRQLMAAVPVVAQQFNGTVDAVSSVVLTFDVALDPTTAENPDAYAMVRKYRKESINLFGKRETSSDSNRIRIESATYDPAANTVTLVPRNEFALRRNFTVIVVRGSGRNTVLTPSGDAIDGDANGRPGGDVILRYKAAARKKLNFKDADGDRVRLKLEGPGRIFYFLAKRGRSSPTIIFRDTDPTASVLTGTVRQGRRGDGVIDIAQIGSASSAQIAILNDPAFRIRTLTD